MSVQARSLGSAGRPVFGRPVAAVVVAALIATFAVGAPAALADEPPGPGDTAADASQTTAPPPAVEAPPPADPTAAETPPSEPPAADPAPADPPPADPPPADPPAVDPPTADPPPSQSPPVQQPQATDPAPADQAQGEPAPADPSPAQPEPAEPTPPPPGGNHAAAENQSRVIQAVWQVQQGCRTYCHGTSQTQRSEQVSNTIQRATAISGESPNGGSSAQARNESSTIQFVWQMQIGCVAFCFHTSQSQEASQQSYTTQEADAESALAAWAENLAETVQFVFQLQQGCEHECHGVTQHQSSTQGQTTSQSATAEALGDGIGLFPLPDWLTAYAQNIGATIQLIYQYQQALCLEHCMGDAQLQEAIQRAVTDQTAVALAAPPEPPPGEEPPGEEPLPGPAGPGVASEAKPPAAPVFASSGSVRHGFVLGRNRRRTVRRQELVLRAGAPSPGGGQTVPDGPAPVAPAAGGPASRAVRLVAAAGSTSGRAKSIQATDDRRHVRAGGNNLPSQTFAVPSGPNAGGSTGWLLILLLTLAVAALIASLRRVLATTMTRI